MSHPDPSWCARINAHRRVEPSLPVGSPYVKREVPTVHHCERCGAVMQDRHCKIVCPGCGYKRDCSDP
jgi:hypothetical protein